MIERIPQLPWRPTYERETKGPACTEACRWATVLSSGMFGRSDVILHDATSHEQYGKAQGRADVRIEPWDTATGDLLVRPADADAYVAGRRIYCTRIEWLLLRELARNLGHVVPGEVLIHRIWGEGIGYRPDFHVLRVNVARLRGKLGTAKPLLETRPALGYRLVALPYTGPALEGMS